MKVERKCTIVAREEMGDAIYLVLEQTGPWISGNQRWNGIRTAFVRSKRMRI